MDHPADRRRPSGAYTVPPAPATVLQAIHAHIFNLSRGQLHACTPTLPGYLTVRKRKLQAILALQSAMSHKVPHAPSSTSAAAALAAPLLP